MITKSGDVLTTVEKNHVQSCKSYLARQSMNQIARYVNHLEKSLGPFIILASNTQGMISNSRDIKWIEKTIKKIEGHLEPNQLNLIKHCSKVFKKIFSSNLPSGVIHSDLFRDNVLANNNKITGIIDYYYSFNGPLIYELAVIANDWCVNKNGSINTKNITVLLTAIIQ